MLIVQKYSSLEELDWEHQTSLESFLSADIPSWEWLRREERKLRESGKLFIFLFFCNRHNIPVGVAFAHRQDIKQKHLGLVQKISSWPGKSPAKLNWLIPGLDSSCSFHPEFEQEGFSKLLTLADELQKKYPLELEIFKVPSEQEMPTGALTNSCFSLPFLSFNGQSLHQLHKNMTPDMQEHIKEFLMDQKDGPTKFDSNFEGGEHFNDSDLDFMDRAETKLIALIHEQRPLFIGQIWRGLAGDYFFDFSVKPVGGGKDLKYYYFFFLYKLSELCPRMKGFKKLKFLRNSLYQGIEQLGFTETKKKDVIIAKTNTSYSEYSLLNLCDENKRTAF